MDAQEQIWAAVLKLSIKDAVEGPSVQELKDYVSCRTQDANDWLSSSRNDVGSFFWVCDMLGLEPTAVRREIKAMKKARHGNGLGP